MGEESGRETVILFSETVPALRGLSEAPGRANPRTPPELTMSHTGLFHMLT